MKAPKTTGAAKKGAPGKPSNKRPSPRNSKGVGKGIVPKKK